MTCTLSSVYTATHFMDYAPLHPRTQPHAHRFIIIVAGLSRPISDLMPACLLPAATLPWRQAKRTSRQMNVRLAHAARNGAVHWQTRAAPGCVMYAPGLTRHAIIIAIL